MGCLKEKAASKGVIWAAVSFWIAFVAAGAGAQPQLPEGVLGERARAMVTILTGPGGDATAVSVIEAIVARNWAASALAQRPAAERAQALAGVRIDLGPAALERVEAKSDNEVLLVFHSTGKGLWLTVRMKLEPQPPRGILGAAIEIHSEPPADSAPAFGPKLTPQELVAQAAARVDELAASDAFSGVLLIARRGEVLLERAAGLAEREKKVPVTPATRFNIGSISKAFTQVAIAQLAAAGKLTLDDKIARHLPDYPDRTIAERVTLQQLLAHRSGMGDFFNERFTPQAAAGLRTLADYLPLFSGQALEFEPGTNQRYSNAGYIVLGLVVERLTGESFPDYVAEKIFGPAGMTASGWLRRDALPGDAAVGYARAGWQDRSGRPVALADPASPPTSPRHANTGDLPAIGSSAGGSYSTARDLLAFAQALGAGKLGQPERYAQQGGLGIAGGTGGANAVLEADWKSGWTIVVLENVDPPAAETLARELRALVARLGPERP